MAGKARVTKGEIRKRLMEEGKWRDFLAFREGLARKRYERAVAWVIATERYYPGEYEPVRYRKAKEVPAAQQFVAEHGEGPEPEEDGPEPAEGGEVVLGPEPAEGGGLEPDAVVMEEEIAGFRDWTEPNLRKSILWVASHLYDMKVKRGPSKMAMGMLHYFRGTNATERVTRHREFYTHYLPKLMGRAEPDREVKEKASATLGLIDRVLDGLKSAVPGEGGEG